MGYYSKQLSIAQCSSVVRDFSSRILDASLTKTNTAALLQAWNYYRAFHKRDSLWVQGLVGLVMVCDVCQIAFLCAALYECVCFSSQSRVRFTHVKLVSRWLLISKHPPAPPFLPSSEHRSRIDQGDPTYLATLPQCVLGDLIPIEYRLLTRGQQYFDY